MRRPRFRAVPLAAVLLAGQMGAASAESFAIEVAISLSREAVRRLAAEAETMVLSVSYYGEPNAAGLDHVDAIGRIDLGTATVALPGGPVMTRIGGSEVMPERLRWVEGPVWVNINVWSARRSGPDNILDCDFFDGRLARATARPVALRCALIGEGYASRVLD